jgi:hypothetical protein
LVLEEGAIANGAIGHPAPGQLRPPIASKPG